MYHTFIILRGDLYCSVHAGSSGTANKQRELDIPALHFMSHVYHFIKRWCDQPAESNDINLLFNCGVQNFISWNHHTQVNDIITITTQYNTNNILPDIMHIA